MITSERKMVFVPNYELIQSREATEDVCIIRVTMQPGNGGRYYPASDLRALLWGITVPVRGGGS